MISLKSENPNAGSNLFFLFIVALILTCVVATKMKGQPQIERAHRFTDKQAVVSKFPVEGITFGEDTSTIISLNICVDSVAPDKQRVILFAYYPGGRVGKAIKIGFENGETITLGLIKSDHEYGEYLVSQSDFRRLREHRFDYLNFVGVAQCISIRDKTFFRDFLKTL